MLVDEDQAHRPQPELLDPRDNLDRRLRLLIRVQLVPPDEPCRSQTQTLARLTSSLSTPSRAYAAPAELCRERAHDHLTRHLALTTFGGSLGQDRLDGLDRRPSALRPVDFQEAVESWIAGRCQSHLFPLPWEVSGAVLRDASQKPRSW
jgi:hypothetical protein